LFYYETAISNNPLWNTFTYSYDHQISPGARVIVSFGRKKRQLAYIVREITEKECPEGIQIKSIEEVIDSKSVIDQDYFKLLNWTVDFYLSPPGKVFDFVFKALGSSTIISMAKKNKKVPMTKTGLKK